MFVIGIIGVLGMVVIGILEFWIRDLGSVGGVGVGGGWFFSLDCLGVEILLFLVMVVVMVVVVVVVIVVVFVWFVVFVMVVIVVLLVRSLGFRNVGCRWVVVVVVIEMLVELVLVLFFVCSIFWSCLLVMRFLLLVFGDGGLIENGG